MVLISLRFKKYLRPLKLTHFHLSVKGKGVPVVPLPFTIPRSCAALIGSDRDAEEAL
jgi:hypothetical protein